MAGDQAAKENLDEMPMEFEKYYGLILKRTVLEPGAEIIVDAIGFGEFAGYGEKISSGG